MTQRLADRNVHRYLLASAILAWLVGIGGFFWAPVAAPQATILTAQMSSPSTYASITWIFVGWWIAAAAFGVSLVAFALLRGSRSSVLPAILVSGAYAVPILVLLLR